MIVVVGAGIGGLAAAYELRRRGKEVLVLEASSRAGGVVRSEPVDGYLCEHAAASMLPGAAAELASTLGLDLVAAAPTARRRWVFRRGRLHAVPASPSALLASDLLSGRGKLRLLGEPFSGRPPGDESIAAFGRRRLGAEATDALLKPLVVGIYAGDAERLSVAAALPRLHRLEEQYGSLLLGLVRGGGAAPGAPMAPREGMEALPRALAAALGDALKLGVTVDGIERGVVRAGEQTFAAERIVMAAPARAAAELLSLVDVPLGRGAREIQAVNVVVVHVALPRAEVAHTVDGFGFLVADNEPVRVLGCVFESSVWPNRAPEGYVLLRCIYGGARDPGAIDLSDADMGPVVAADLERTLGVRGPARILRIVRWRPGIPQYVLGHVSRRAELDARAAAVGVVLAGSAYHGVGVTDLCADATRVADACG